MAQGMAVEIRGLWYPQLGENGRGHIHLPGVVSSLVRNSRTRRQQEDLALGGPAPTVAAPVEVAVVGDDDHGPALRRIARAAPDRGEEPSQITVHDLDRGPVLGPEHAGLVRDPV